MREPAAFGAALAALGQRKRTVRLDQATAADALARLIAESRRHGRARRRSDHAMKAVKNATEDRRRARRARARRRGGRALPRLVRPRGAGRQAHRDRRGRGAGKLSAATPACSRTCRFRPSPAPDRTARSCTIASPRKTNRPIAPGELFLIDSGAQYQDGTTDITRTVAVGDADRGDARPLHPRAQGPHRDRARGVSRRHDRRAARLVRAPVSVARRPRFRSRHRPRRRQLSLGARRPGAHLQARHGARSSAA